ncbi:hypothetical protein [Alicyclobacillus sp. SP_1]|uniref:hypothetical protein n=1 Tax=Alicyclobacillus sp. SP_1 TaxID=2942475 RepID=UPI002157C8A3|nr:hypothetical protein [Alicyclobacillus sp. SP_1]
MPTVICIGAVNVNSPQQNCGVFIGEINCGGWDANEKQNLGHGALYGFFNTVLYQQSYVWDNMEIFDSWINDQDFKPMMGVNV